MNSFEGHVGVIVMETGERKDRRRRGGQEHSPGEPISQVERRKQAFSVFGGAIERAGDGESAAALAEMLARIPAWRVRSRMGFTATRGACTHLRRGLRWPAFPSPARMCWILSAVAARSWSRRWPPGARRWQRRQPAGRDHRARALDHPGAEGRQRLGGERAPDRRGGGGTCPQTHSGPETLPGWAREENDRFFPHVALELYGLRALIGETKEDDVGRALRACLSSILVKFMRGSDQDQARRIGRGVPSRFFAGRAEELARGLEALERRTPAARRCRTSVWPMRGI